MNSQRSNRSSLPALLAFGAASLVASAAFAYHADPAINDVYCEGDTATVDYTVTSWTNTAYSSENDDIRVEVSVDGGDWIEVGSGALVCNGGYVTVEVDPGRFVDLCGDGEAPFFTGTAPLPVEGDSFQLRARPAGLWGGAFEDYEIWYAPSIGDEPTPDATLAGDFAISVCVDDDCDRDRHDCDRDCDRDRRGCDRDRDDDDCDRGRGRHHDWDRDDDDCDRGRGRHHGWDRDDDDDCDRGRGHDWDRDDDDDCDRGRGHDWDRDDDDDCDRDRDRDGHHGSSRYGRRSGGRGWW